MKQILSIALGGLAGYCVWTIFKLDAVGMTVNLIAMPLIKSTSEPLVSAFGDPVIAKWFATSVYFALVSLPGAIAVGAASAMFLTRNPHTRLFFYSVMIWPIFQFFFDLVILDQIASGNVKTENSQLFMQIYNALDRKFHSLFIMFAVYYITAFALLTVFVRFRLFDKNTARP